MKPRNKSNSGNRGGMARASQSVYALRHMETGEYLCLRQNSREYVVCFSNGDGAFQFRSELRLLEYVDVTGTRLAELPFQYYWLDGEMISRAVVRDDSARLP